MPRAKLSPHQDSRPKSASTKRRIRNPAIGRPTTYNPTYCDKVISLGKQGDSPCQIACKLNTDRETLIKWAERWPAFGTSLARAKAEEQAWWEARGRKGLEDRHFNAHLWVKIMTCRFRQDYSDRVELTGADGGPILFQTVYEEPPKVIDAAYTATQKTPDSAE